MENTSPALKLAIPRLKQDSAFYHKQQRPSRTQRACNNCRARKVRCTGKSRCRNCVEQDATCIYTKGRRDRLNEVIEQNHDLIDLLKNLSMHVDDVGKRMIDEQLDSLREDDHIPVSATELEAETSGVPGKQPRKRTLSHESNQAHSLSEPDISESINGNASSMNVSPDSGPCLPVQYPTRAMGPVKTQNMFAFQAQRQARNFGNLQFNPSLEFNPNLQFNPNLTLDTNLPLPLKFGNSFMTNFDQPGRTPT
ncbi:hypothetical protein DM02DRAFT_620527 [Periconia macrospinosa]|uniref:Zn(2)-C6 fungal-type domain-containing protein n=1 Tax=Periconia macrospinosa TaxID=97972 RepID=A0A2V1D2F4_9PLEO|nr:hypothetical protein DM02DRAFT_620527 [Periconia macrospinosa]